MKLKSLENVVRLTINDDPERVVSFNPNDVSFAERFFDMMDNLEEKNAEYDAKLDEIQNDESINAYGIPVSIRKEAKLTAEICRYMREQVDFVFGEGTSQTVFGDVNTVEMFGEFFAGIAPHVSAARSKATKKYTAPKDGALK